MAILAPVRSVASHALQLFRRLTQELTHDDYSGLAAQMTYYFMLGLFPTLILVVGVIGLLPLDQSVEQVTENMLAGLPIELASLAREFLSDFRGGRHGTSLVLWLIAALWAASRGFAGARKGLDRIMKTEEKRNPIFRRAQDVLLTIICVMLLGLLYALLLGGRRMLEFILRAAGHPEDLGTVFALMSWPITLAIGTAAVAVLYRVLPDRKLPWRPLFAGALSVMLLWGAMTGGIRLWIGMLGDYDRLYGSLARFFVLMFVVWLYSLTLLLGAEVAMQVAQRSGRDSSAPAEPAALQ